MTNYDRAKLLEEFETIRNLSDDKLVHAEKAVEWARANPESALARQLEWNDSTAAEGFRVQQVRSLIRVLVVPASDKVTQIRGYVSLPSDRTSGGGYRRTEDALARAREEMIAEALRALTMFGNRYSHLPELSGLFSDVNKIVTDYRSQRMAQSA